MYKRQTGHTNGMFQNNLLGILKSFVFFFKGINRTGKKEIRKRYSVDEIVIFQ